LQTGATALLDSPTPIKESTRPCVRGTPPRADGRYQPLPQASNRKI